MKNPNSLQLVPGNYYMIKSSTPGNRLTPNKVLMYTSDMEDAYYAPGMFGPECHVTVLHKMEIVA